MGDDFYSDSRTKTLTLLQKTIDTYSISERFVLGVLLFVVIASGATLLYRLNNSVLVEVPKEGGTYREGIIGSPRFINPILSVSNVDQDLSTLIYAGLMRQGEDGTFVPDMAKSVEISEDGLVYTIELKDNLTFHDNTPVTADDVIFTVTRAQDPGLKSPRRASWDGVSVEKVADNKVNFILPQAYVPFLENLTMGILPSHLWRNATTEDFAFSPFNTEAIGSGPFKIQEIVRNESGIPQYYILEPFDNYAGGRPYINELVMRFYTNEDSLLEGFSNNEFDSLNSVASSLLPTLLEMRSDVEVLNVPFSRTFAAFFNQNKAPLFRDKAVREALSVATDRESIIDEVLHGYGTPLSGPIPPSMHPSTTTIATTTSLNSLEDARAILRRGGWTIASTTNTWTKRTEDGNLELSFSLSTSNAPELRAIANILKEQWEQLGAKVEVKLFEQSDLTQSVIRPRDFDVLLFGTVIGKDLDFYSFWHSSQRNDPGLNIALYTNLSVDAALASERTSQDVNERAKQLLIFEQELQNDIPAVFLYVPDFLYIIPKNLRGMKMETLTAASERFFNIESWHLDTEEVWPFFTN